MQKRVRLALVLAAAAAGSPAAAHHGWGVFDVDRPVYVEGTIVAVTWGNPHPTVTIEVTKAATGRPWSDWRPPDAWVQLGAMPVLERVSVNPAITGRVFMEFGSLHRQPTLGFGQAPNVGEPMNAIVFPSCRGERVGAARLMRPSLVEYRGQVLSQQSHRLPSGCSGRRTADF
jgi:hypothetical protein